MQEQIIAMISEIKDDAQLANRLNEHSSIMEDGGLDSLQLITFLLKVEERFDIEIDFEQFDFDFWSRLRPSAIISRSCRRRHLYER